MHKRIKDITGMSKRRTTSLLIDTDERGNNTNIYTEEGPEILQSEVEHALKNSKNGKASGPDEIPVELLQLMDDESITIEEVPSLMDHIPPSTIFQTYNAASSLSAKMIDFLNYAIWLDGIDQG
ncbi:hypothetical protein J437_LFUL012873 [Ladona fulva]|uniref:Uncharacterized protein n=1 Tax=Ladona fulva TaxID=123851 RepID=A0A8K0KH78_LADFU|nr:hypothetical protein J437_LFUL012873 [Ladona fulva]